MVSSTWTGAIEQVFFGFEQRAGMSLLASSIEHEGIERGVGRRLKPHAGLGRIAHVRPPTTTLSCLHLDDGSAAILRRVDRGDTPGRTNSHALIGPPEVLTPSLAIGLRDWSGWLELRPAERRLPGVDREALAAAVTDPEDLRRQPADGDDQLVRVLAEMLEQPALPVSVVGCANGDVLPLLVGLIGAGRGVLPWRVWTFSTYETAHSDDIDSLPEIVFLPMRPTNVRVANRAVVDPGRERSGDPRFEDWARELVDRYRADVIGDRTEPVFPRHTVFPRHADGSALAGGGERPTVHRAGVRVDPAPVHAPPSVPDLTPPIRAASTPLPVGSPPSSGAHASGSSTSDAEPAGSATSDAEPGAPDVDGPPAPAPVRSFWPPVRVHRARRLRLVLLVATGALLLSGVGGYLLGRSGVLEAGAAPIIGDRSIAADLKFDLGRNVPLWLALRRGDDGAKYVPLRAFCNVVARRWICQPAPGDPEPRVGDHYVLYAGEDQNAITAIVGDPAADPESGLVVLAEVDITSR